MSNKILIIEDDPLVSRMYQKALGFEDLDVEMAVNGREGVEKAKKLKPSLILCDVMMPEMNGMEVLEHLKADPETSGIPVIMLTNLSGAHDAETAMAKGAFAYMVKSAYKPRDVAQTVKNTLSGGQQINQSASTMVSAAAGQTGLPVQPPPANVEPPPATQTSQAPTQSQPEPSQPSAQPPTAPVESQTKPPVQTQPTDQQPDDSNS